MRESSSGGKQEVNMLIDILIIKKFFSFYFKFINIA